MKSDVEKSGAEGLPDGDDGWIGPAIFFGLLLVTGLAVVAAFGNGYYAGRVAAQTEMLEGRAK